MQAAPTPVIDFFNGFKQYVIPLFQRPYSWEQRNWKLLWADLSELAGEDAVSGTHFMGAIVTTPTSSVPVGVTKHMVIDGQQRLTTIAILLCAIRDALPEGAPERQRLAMYLENSSYQGDESLKLLPTQADRDDFRRICKAGECDGDSRVCRGYEFFAARLRKNGKLDLDGARQVLEIVERRLQVVSISLDDRDDPYVIFESLNFKGSPLTQVDLARNYFLMRFNVDEQPRVYADKWRPVEDRLGETHMPRYLRQFLRMGGNEVRKNEVYAALKARLADKQPEEVAVFLDEIRGLAERFGQLARAFDAPEARLDDRLRFLADWEVGVADPLLLLILKDLDSGRLSLEQACQQACIVESFVVRREVCAVPTNQLRKIFLSACRAREPGAPAAWLATHLGKGEHGARWPSDDEFKDAWTRYRAYAKPARCRALLARFEQSSDHRELAALDKTTIEHVMPQTLNDWWRGHLGPAGQELHGALVHTIGNLTLSAYNGELSNKPFSEKVKLLADSNLTMNRELATNAQWKPDDIRGRSSRLAESAVKIWPGPQHGW